MVLETSIEIFLVGAKDACLNNLNFLNHRTIINVLTKRFTRNCVPPCSTQSDKLFVRLLKN